MSTGHTSCMHIVLGKPPAAQLQLFPSMALPPRASLQGRLPSTLSPPRLPCSLFLLVSHIYFPYLEGEGEWMEIVLLLLLAIGVYISVSLVRLCVLAHLTCCAPESVFSDSASVRQQLSAVSGFLISKSPKSTWIGLCTLFTPATIYKPLYAFP